MVLQKGKMKQKESIQSTLIVKFIKGEISGKELTALERWIDATPANRKLFESFLLEENWEKRRLIRQQLDQDKAYRQIQRKISRRQMPVLPKRVHRWKRVSAYAAAIVIPVALGILWFALTEPEIEAASPVAVIEAGNHKAQLIFSTGEKLELDQTTTDTIYKDNTTLVAQNGQVAYTESDQAEAEINRLLVPRGGEYQMVLADGTQVWLNSESELVFPTAFNGDVRSVEVSGEAYFEVSPNKNKPFIVQTSGQQIQVLGTAFNVRNYTEEEQVVTTLVEGSIALTSDHADQESMQLNPGEQTVLDFIHGTISKQLVDVGEFISWKNGEYLFKSKPLVDVMTELARWYDLEIEFGDSSIEQSLVTGKFKRANSFNAFVDLLDKIEVAHFKIEGNKVTVTK